MGVSLKDMGGDAQIAPNYVFGGMYKNLYFALKIPCLLKAGVNQDAHMPPGEMAAVIRERRRHKAKDFGHKQGFSWVKMGIRCSKKKGSVLPCHVFLTIS